MAHRNTIEKDVKKLFDPFVSKKFSPFFSFTILMIFLSSFVGGLSAINNTESFLRTGGHFYIIALAGMIYGVLPMFFFYSSLIDNNIAKLVIFLDNKLNKFEYTRVVANILLTNVITQNLLYILIIIFIFLTPLVTVPYGVTLFLSDMSKINSNQS